MLALVKPFLEKAKLSILSITGHWGSYIFLHGKQYNNSYIENTCIDIQEE
jgi:hypothetical protein